MNVLCTLFFVYQTVFVEMLCALQMFMVSFIPPLFEIIMTQFKANKCDLTAYNS